MARTIGTRAQKRAMKKSAKAYANTKNKASKNVMKKKDANTTYGYAKTSAKLGKYKKQKLTTKTGRKSLKK